MIRPSGVAWKIPSIALSKSTDISPRSPADARGAPGSPLSFAMSADAQTEVNQREHDEASEQTRDSPARRAAPFPSTPCSPRLPAGCLPAQRFHHSPLIGLQLHLHAQTREQGKVIKTASAYPTASVAKWRTRKEGFDCSGLTRRSVAEAHSGSGNAPAANIKIIGVESEKRGDSHSHK